MIYGARMKPAFRIILLQRHNKFCGVIIFRRETGWDLDTRLIFFLAAGKRKFQRANVTAICVCCKWIHPTIGWRWDEHGTQKHTHGSWILCSVLRVLSKTIHSRFCITSWKLPYTTIYCLASRFILPRNLRARRLAASLSFSLALGEPKGIEKSSPG